jgi:hypothetical protein
MSTDLTNLMQQVHDYFLQLFHQTSGATHGTTFLAFAPIGTPVTEDAYKRSRSDPAPSPGWAVEWFSGLANAIPAVTEGGLQMTEKSVDGFYNILLPGSQATPTNGDGDNALFHALKRQALQTFDQADLGSLQGSYRFRPVYARPRNWYDAALAANWTTYTVTSDMRASSTSDTDPPSSIARAPSTPPWIWRVVRDDMRPILQNPELLESVPFDEVVLDTPHQQFEGMPGGTLAGRTVLAESSAVPIESAQITPGAETADIGTSLQGNDVGQIVARSLPIVPGIGDTATIFSGVIDTASILQPRLQVARTAYLLRDTTSQPVVSQQISISLKYCLVDLDRHWLSLDYLSTRGWYMPGYTAGWASTGTAENNTGEFPILPVACLVIKDLTISVDATDDIDTAQQSAAFGPFSLVGRAVDTTNGTLRIDGMQIIGWVCQVMPKLPPLPSPEV